MIFTFSLLLLLTLLLIAGATAAEGVRRGLSLCYRAVLPALFPAMVVCNLIAETAEYLPIAPGRSIWGTSQLCGFPAGIQMVVGAYKREVISKEQALRLSVCCANASPSFLILYAGEGILGSRRDGWILLFCQFTVSLLLALGSGALRAAPLPPAPKRPLTSILAESFSSAAIGGLIMTCYITFFSMLAAFPLFERIHGLLELTGGIGGNFYAVAALIGFSGCAILMQNISRLSAAGLSPLPMLAGRVVYTAAMPLLGFFLKHLTNF